MAPPSSSPARISSGAPSFTCATSTAGNPPVSTPPKKHRSNPEQHSANSRSASADGSRDLLHRSQEASPKIPPSAAAAVIRPLPVPSRVDRGAISPRSSPTSPPTPEIPPEPADVQGAHNRRLRRRLRSSTSSPTAKSPTGARTGSCRVAKPESAAVPANPTSPLRRSQMRRTLVAVLSGVDVPDSGGRRWSLTRQPRRPRLPKRPLPRVHVGAPLTGYDNPRR